MNTQNIILLEPPLEEQAGFLTAPERLKLAAIYERWARQLRVSAEVMDAYPAKNNRRNRRTT